MALPQKLVTEVLKLPEDERAELAHVLLESLEDAESELTSEERAEVDEGFAEIDGGAYITADDLLEQMRQLRSP